jgi:hypothetical protein
MTVKLGGRDPVKRIVSLLFACLLVAVMVAAQDANQNWVKCRVLQFNLNRLYFDVGEESLVFAGHRAVVMKKKDTLWSGVIERAYDGVSISERLEKPIELKSISAFVQVAAVDSHAVIRIGTTLSQAVTGMLSIAVLDSIAVLTHGLVDSVVVKSYDDAQAMEIDFQSGMLDGLLTYRGDGFGNDSRVESVWAPYIAALVPYGSSTFRFQTAVTQTLVVRLDTAIARGQFDGTDIRFETGLVAPTQATEWFEFQPERGKLLLHDLAARGVPVRIYVPDSELLKVAGYLADILAREQVKSVLVDTWREPDITLAFIPSNRRLEAAVKTVLQLVGPANTAVLDMPDGICCLRKILDEMEVAPDSIPWPWRLVDIEDMLQSDLSCRPLFRPRIYFVSHNSIRGSLFNSDGMLNPVGLMRVQPVDGSGSR